MGIDQQLFLSEIQSHFICIICQEVLEDPVECEQCQSPYCRLCIEGWMNSSQAKQTKQRKCPAGCAEIKIKDLHKVLKEQLDNLQMKCLNEIQGCQFQGTVYFVLEHFKNDCLFRQVTCEFPGCEVQGIAQDILQHQEMCSYKTTKCPECDEFIQKNQKDHSCIRTLKSLMEDQSTQIKQLQSEIQEMNKKIEEQIQSNQGMQRQIHILQHRQSPHLNVQMHRHQNHQIPPFQRIPPQSVLNQQLENIKKITHQGHQKQAIAQFMHMHVFPKPNIRQVIQARENLQKVVQNLMSLQNDRLLELLANEQRLIEEIIKIINSTV